MVNSDASSCIAYYISDIREGNGKLNYSNGDIFVGTFINDLPNGSGEKIFTDGSKYIGDF